LTRILVVEDNPVNLRLARMLLESDGYSTSGAIDAEHAERSILDHPPDLILMDVGLPGKDGYTFTRELRSRPETQHIPILIVTSFAMKGDREKALEAGCSGYLTKPVRREALIGAVRQLIGESDRTVPPMGAPA
jgi:CheY-like chemotaxis protein